MKELTILMPCLNEVKTLPKCIHKAIQFLEDKKISGEVLIADNGSTDGSQKVAIKNGARVIQVKCKGYGSALMGGILAAEGRFIIMGDADESYDFFNLSPFIEKLRQGHDLVIGNRFKGGIQAGAMPMLHRYLGNPILSFIGRIFFNSSLGDFHCGLRGFRKDAIIQLNLRTTGMEFASEIIVKATMANLSIAEVPTTLAKDGRDRPPHLNTWRDGWRHLRFLLLYSPGWLFLYPGLFIMVFGLTLMFLLSMGPIRIGEINIDVHTMLYSSCFIIIGFQSIVFFLYAKVFSMNEGLLPKDKMVYKFYNLLSLEKGIIIGGFLMMIGIILSVDAVLEWKSKSFGNLDPSIIFRQVIPAVTFVILGIQLILYSFFLSILGLKQKLK